MSARLHILFFSALIIGISVYALQWQNVPLPWLINNYLNDFLIMPIVLYCCLWVLKKTRGKNYQLSLELVLYACIMYGFLFEVLFPKYLVRYTADFFDVLLYFAGGILFYIQQKK